MNSLELPFDLIWEGQPEPLSPSQLAIAGAEDILIYENDFANDLLLHDDDDFLKPVYNDDDDEFLKPVYNDDDVKKSPFELLLELQQHVIDSESSGDDADHWLDQTINFSPLDLYASAPLLKTDQQPVKVEYTTQLLREFDSVLNAVELTHLTPPQSPPLDDYESGLKEEEIIYPSSSILLHQQPQLQPPAPPLPSPPSESSQSAQTAYYIFECGTPVQSPITHDIAHEMEVVEELVRARAEHLPDWTDDENSSECPSSSSASYSPRSESSFAGSNYSNDDEWSPKRERKSVAGSGGADTKATAKHRTRPYGRSSEDKKCRKKEQNKNAATRYRQKKKAEIEIALDEERDLLDVHTSLEVKCADVQREIKYLKSLMRDLYRAKGLL